MTQLTKLDTIEQVFNISEKRMRFIEEIVKYDLRPQHKKLGNLLYAVATCSEFSEHEKVYAAFKVTEYSHKRGWFRSWH